MTQKKIWESKSSRENVLKRLIELAFFNTNGFHCSSEEIRCISENDLLTSNDGYEFDSLDLLEFPMLVDEEFFNKDVFS